MILTYKDASNLVYVTLRELTRNQVNPYYTWTLTNKDTLEVTTFYADNLTGSPYYDLFNITLSSTQSGITAGIIDIEFGQYTYNVYEMTNQYDLNISNAVGLVENGILIVNATYSHYASFTQSDNDTITTYNNLDDRI
jgi:hypothetical protein